MEQIGQVSTEFGLANVMKTCYTNNHPAIILEDANDGSRIATLSVNLPDVPLEDGEFHVKTWNENELIIPVMFDCGLFFDTGKRVRAGQAIASVWKFVAE